MPKSNSSLGILASIILEKESRIFDFPFDEKWKSFKYLGIPLSLKPLTSILLASHLG
jgi:hypothetical protein